MNTLMYVFLWRPFYSIPKIHKSLVAPPGRPIVSEIGSITENVSRLVDFFLMLHVTRLPSYVKDMSNVWVSCAFLRNALLVSIDVEAFYSSIPHDQGIKVVKTFLMEQNLKQWEFNTFLPKLLSFILRQNWFIFMDSH